MSFWMTLKNEMGYKVAAIGRRVGKPRYYVSKRLSLLRLHPKLREAVRDPSRRAEREGNPATRKQSPSFLS